MEKKKQVLLKEDTPGSLGIHSFISKSPLSLTVYLRLDFTKIQFLSKLYFFLCEPVSLMFAQQTRLNTWSWPHRANVGSSIKSMYWKSGKSQQLLCTVPSNPLHLR